MPTSKRSTADRRARRRRILRGLGLAVLAVLLGAAWLWQRTLPLKAVEVVGNAHAPDGEIVALAQAQPDSVALFALSPALLADRAQRHPWVRAARVRRLPTGTLRIAVTEREPAVLVLARDGRPAHFLDGDGFAMPLADSALADVPVLRGAPAYHPTQPVESDGLRSLLAALADADAATHALVSEVEWGREVTLWTTPTTSHASVPVRLSADGGHADQLRRLRAFYDQSVLPRSAVRFRRVDLRFAGQVVTLESDPLAPDSTRRARPDSVQTPRGASPPANA